MSQTLRVNNWITFKIKNVKFSYMVLFLYEDEHKGRFSNLH